MKTTLFTLALAVLAFIPQSFAMENMTQENSAPIKAVVFYADSCGACKILEPRMADAMDIINKDKINVVKFDFSNKDSIAATRELAVTQGINNILQKYGAKTGFVILVNNAGEEIATLKVDHTTADIASELAKAIANAS